MTEVEVYVRFGEVDADRVLNNAVHFRYLEQARLEHLIRLGVISHLPTTAGDPNIPMTLAEVSCRYRAPARFRDVLLVQAFTLEVRHRSFILGYRIVNKSTGTRVAEGRSALVWLGADGRPAPIPNRERRLLVDSLVGEEAVTPNPGREG